MNEKAKVIDIASQLIQKKSVTPDDDGCQKYIKAVSYTHLRAHET